MNPRLETCINCKEQCTLEKRSDVIVFKAKNGILTTGQQIREQVSRMSLKANQIGCPESELQRIRKATLTQIDPFLAKREKPFRIERSDYFTRPRER
jgi:hypothetical protein